MKYVFIVNPKSGKSEIKGELLNSLEKYKNKNQYNGWQNSYNLLKILSATSSQ